MNPRPASNRLPRRIRIATFSATGVASLATVGLIVGVAHSSSDAAVIPSTSTSSNSSSSSSSSPSRSSTSPNSSSGLSGAQHDARPVGGSNGS